MDDMTQISTDRFSQIKSDLLLDGDAEIKQERDHYEDGYSERFYRNGTLVLDRVRVLRGRSLTAAGSNSLCRARRDLVRQYDEA